MLVSTVAGNFRHSRVGHVSTLAETGDCDDQISDLMSSTYQQLLLTGGVMDLDAMADYQHRPQQRQPSVTMSCQHAIYADQRLEEPGMTYLGQALMPSGYSMSSQLQQRRQSQQPSPTQSRSCFSLSDDTACDSITIANHQLQAWPQRQPLSSSTADISQQRFFDEFQQRQTLRAGSNISISGSSASIDVPIHRQSHVAYKQMSPTHHSSQLNILVRTTQQQHHHHHSMPTRLHDGSHIGDRNRESSSRERELGGAPNMVGVDGMPEPALRPKGPKLKFTRDDDALLIELKEGKNLTWKQIADFFPGRSSGTLQVRYCTKLKAKTTVWTDDMVQRLRNAIAEYDNDRWRIIASKVGNGFSAVACQDRALELDIEEGGGSFMMAGELEEEDD